jgi:hypothetical protein
MKETDQLIIGALLRLGIQQREPGRGEPPHLGPDIRYLEGNVVHALPTFVDIPADDALGTETLQQLDLRVPLPKESCVDALALDPLGLVTGALEQGLEQGNAASQIFDGDADMFYFEHNLKIADLP